MTTIQDIFREVHMEGVRFDTKQVTSMVQEVEVRDSSVFEVGKMSWMRDGNKWIRNMKIQSDTQYRMDLLDNTVLESTHGNSTELYVRRSTSDNLLMIGAYGYGEKNAEEGKGYPIVIEFHKGELRLLIWSDINEEEPIIVSLENARENARENVKS